MKRSIIILTTLTAVLVLGCSKKQETQSPSQTEQQAPATTQTQEQTNQQPTGQVTEQAPTPSQSQSQTQTQTTQQTQPAQTQPVLASGCECSKNKPGCKCGHCTGAVDECHCSS